MATRRGMHSARRLGGARGSNAAVAYGPTAAQRLARYALTGFSASSYFTTAAGGGEAGVASGFGEVILMMLTQLPTSARRVALKGWNGVQGWLVDLPGNNAFQMYIGDGGGVARSIALTLTASDVGRLLVVTLGFDGATLYGETHRGENRKSLAVTGYSPAAGASTHQLGAEGGSTALPGGHILGEMTFRGAPSVAQLQALYDVVRALGDLPASIAGATVTHRWSLRDQLLGVVNPAGRNTYGARGWLGNWLSTAPGLTTGIGAISSVSFYAQAYIRIESILSTTGAYVMGRTNGGPQGVICDMNTVIRGTFGNGTVAIATPTYTFVASDLGRKVAVTVLYDRPAGLVRLYMDGVEIGAGTAIADYIAYQNATFGFFEIGRAYVFQGAGNPFTCFQAGGGNFLPSAAQLRAQALAAEVSGKLVPLAGLTDHFWDIDAAIQANGGVVPASIPDLVGSDAMSKTGTLETGVYTETAPPAPAQLTDTITQAAGDALARVGSPRVVAIDTSIDGRVTKGVLGFAFTSYLVTSAGLGILGLSTGLSVLWAGRLDTVTGSTVMLASGLNAAGNRGWMLQMLSTTVVRFVTYNAAGSATEVQIAISAVDAAQRIAFGASYDGTTLRLVAQRDNAQVFASAASNTLSPSTEDMRLGQHPVANSLVAGTWFELAGGNVALTLPELQAELDTWRAAGEFRNLAGKLAHAYQPTKDIAANNGDLPAQVLDRIGTDHLARLDIDTPKVGPNSIRGVGPYTTTDVWQSAAGGGIVGANAGFHVVVDVVFTKVPGSEQIASNSLVAGGVGWFVQVNGTGILRGSIGGIIATNGYQLTVADLNKRLRFELEKTATVARVYVNGVQAGADAAASSYNVPTATSMQVGNAISLPFVSGWVELVQGGDTNLTAGERTALNADLTQPAPAIIGKTQKRWRFHDDTSTTPTKVPRTSIERVSGASIDVLTRYGAGLQVAQRTERAWSYETTPIMKAGQFSVGNRWEGAATLETAPNIQGFFVAILCRPRAVATTGRLFSHANGGTVGYFSTCAAGGSLQFTLVDAGGANKAAPAIAATADSKVRAALWVYDAPANVLRTYHNRAQVSTGTSITGIALANAGVLGLTLGSFFGGGSPQPEWDILGLLYGVGVPTLAQFQSWEDASMAIEDIDSIQGATHLYSVKRGLQGTTLKDLIGSYDIPAVGSPVVADIYARAFAR